MPRVVVRDVVVVLVGGEIVEVLLVLVRSVRVRTRCPDRPRGSGTGGLLTPQRTGERDHDA